VSKRRQSGWLHYILINIYVLAILELNILNFSFFNRDRSAALRVVMRVSADVMVHLYTKLTLHRHWTDFLDRFYTGPLFTCSRCNRVSVSHWLKHDTVAKVVRLVPQRSRCGSARRPAKLSLMMWSKTEAWQKHSRLLSRHWKLSAKHDLSTVICVMGAFPKHTQCLSPAERN
jgi:hypothetical protein